MQHATNVSVGRFVGAAAPGSAEDGTPQFAAIIKHLKGGVKGFTVAAAVKNIEGWEASLEKLDTTAARTIVKDLENLKKHLQADPQKGDQIQKLVAKLTKETVAIADKTDSKDAERIKELGEALGHIGEEQAE